jgi:hypothetical protein
VDILAGLIYHREIKNAGSKDNKVVLSHQGRWHIADPNKEEKKENLRFVDFDSNGYPIQLHFACINKGKNEKKFHGLERKMDGTETWDFPEYMLDSKIMR